MKIEILNHVDPCNDGHCAACHSGPVNANLAIDGNDHGYVCGACQAAIVAGGVTAWKRRLVEKMAEYAMARASAKSMAGHLDDFAECVLTVTSSSCKAFYVPEGGAE